MFFPTKPASALVFLFAVNSLHCGQMGMPGGGGDDGSSDGAETDDEDKAGNKDSSSDGDSERNFEAEEGSCNAWKISYCAAVEDCSAFASHEDCEKDVGYVRCAPEAPILDCQTKIDTARANKSCADLPQECSPVYLADRSVPQKTCKEIYTAICEHGYFCGTEVSIESCAAALEVSLPCSQYTAVLPAGDDCLKAISLQGCGDPFPPICSGVLR